MIFTRDVVLRATLTSVLYTQRVVESARTSQTGAEFRFASLPGNPAGPLGLPDPGAQGGFGCTDGADVLHVQRRSANEIDFPGCADFPYPLVRCGSAR